MMVAARRLAGIAQHLSAGLPLVPVASAGDASLPALLGGSPAVNLSSFGNMVGSKDKGLVEEDLFKWPIITEEDEEAVLDVMRHENMSGTNITRAFESEFAAWMGVDHCLAYPNGTMAILASIYAAGVRRGDEIICPSMTYWGSCTQALQLGAVVVFADIKLGTLCIDETDIEHRITPRTKAIVAVHYAGYPCAMDKICAIAKKHGIKVIEDVSHAHGGTYKGQKVGTFGDVAAMSVMSGKSLAAGEGGLLITNDRRILETAILFTHYESQDRLTIEELKATAGIPHSGSKARMAQICAAIGRVQLSHYDERMAEIDLAMNRFWCAALSSSAGGVHAHALLLSSVGRVWCSALPCRDLLEGTPGIRAHRPPKGEGTMGGWCELLSDPTPSAPRRTPHSKAPQPLRALPVHDRRGEGHLPPGGARWTPHRGVPEGAESRGCRGRRSGGEQPDAPAPSLQHGGRLWGRCAFPHRGCARGAS